MELMVFQALLAPWGQVADRKGHKVLRVPLDRKDHKDLKDP